MEPLEEFCYLGSVVANNGNCQKEIRARIAKTHSIDRQKAGITYEDPAVQHYCESSASMQCQNLAFDQNRNSASGSYMTPMAEEDFKYIMDKYGVQQ